MAKFQKFGGVWRSTACATAQAELEGKTHYADPETLRYFGGRINSCYSVAGGWLLYLQESVQHPTNGRVHRAVYFDVCGNVTHRTEDCKTGRQAEKAGREWLATADVVATTQTAVNDRQKWTRQEADRECQDLTSLFVECMAEKGAEK